jgi:hypothetical protein
MMEILVQEICEIIAKTVDLSFKSPNEAQLTAKGWLS